MNDINIGIGIFLLSIASIFHFLFWMVSRKSKNRILGKSLKQLPKNKMKN